MNLTQNDLQAAFGHPNVKAFYMVVRNGESALDDSAYTLINGGAHFTDFGDHPYAGLSTKVGGRAAGAPQFIPSTWAELAERYYFPDFSPQYQDLGYVGCLVKRNALNDVIEGRFEEAIKKCRLEWTSLPGAAENNKKWNQEKALALYKQYGGTVSVESVPIEERNLPSKENEMGAFVVPLLASILPSIPQLIALFGKGGERADQNAKAAQLVVDTTLKTLGAVNEQQAIEIVTNEPAKLKEVAEAVMAQPYIAALVEVGGGVKGAREFDLATQNQPKPFYKTSAVFYVSCLLIPMVFWYVGSSIVGGVDIPPEMPWAFKFVLMMFGKAWDAGARVGLANLVVGLVLGGIVGVYFGVSVTKQAGTTTGT
jgi:muramidase (phage lysozyme)